MGVKEDIFETFLNKLKEDTQFPDSIVESLTVLIESGEVVTQRKILDMIERDSKNASEDQEN